MIIQPKNKATAIFPFCPSGLIYYTVISHQFWFQSQTAREIIYSGTIIRGLWCEYMHGY